MHYSALILLLLFVFQSWQIGNTECCEATYVRFRIKSNEVCKNYYKSTSYYWTDTCYNKFCGDLTLPTPCCGVGKCNIFCCNCDNGCISGNVVNNVLKTFGSTITLIEPITQKFSVNVKFNNSDENNSTQEGKVDVLVSIDKP